MFGTRRQPRPEDATPTPAPSRRPLPRHVVSYVSRGSRAIPENVQTSAISQFTATAGIVIVAGFAEAQSPPKDREGRPTYPALAEAIRMAAESGAPVIVASRSVVGAEAGPLPLVRRSNREEGAIPFGGQPVDIRKPGRLEVAAGPSFDWSRVIVIDEQETPSPLEAWRTTTTTTVSPATEAARLTRRAT